MSALTSPAFDHTTTFGWADGADPSRQVYRLLDGIRERLDATIAADPLRALVAVHKALGGAR